MCKIKRNIEKFNDKLTCPPGPGPESPMRIKESSYDFSNVPYS